MAAQHAQQASIKALLARLHAPTVVLGSTHPVWLAAHVQLVQQASMLPVLVVLHAQHTRIALLEATCLKQVLLAWIVSVLHALQGLALVW